MKKSRCIIAVVVLALVLALSVSASSNSVNATLTYRDLKITLDGKEITPTDANGNYVEPFIIDGTTYLPVRGIANAMGLGVSWDADTGTVILTTKAAEPVQPATPAAGEPTISQRNALNSALSYLNYSAFSYSGLIKQLEYEKYSTEDATYAADHCGADWNEQAAKSAESYLKYSSFSRDGLIAQLEYEGFTHEQAVYGVTANGY